MAARLGIAGRGVVAGKMREGRGQADVQGMKHAPRDHRSCRFDVLARRIYSVVQVLGGSLCVRTSLRRGWVVLFGYSPIPIQGSDLGKRPLRPEQRVDHPN